MTAFALLLSTSLLALFTLCGGVYGILYGLGRARRAPRLHYGALVAFGFQVATVAAIWLATPLDAGWKVLITALTLVMFITPPLVWRALDRMHKASMPTRGARP